MFQNNILKKYLSTLNLEAVDTTWSNYRNYFLNPEMQQNIRQSKEEQFQEGFLRELFVKVLGYTLNPSPGYNLITEQKNETNAQKADGAIIMDGQVIGIIELKDHKTTDLSKVEPQAFNYKSQHPNARLVVISNFEKLRLYIDNAVEHREWNLFRLTEQQFSELYLCLAWPQVQSGVAIQMKQESVSTEDQITKALYHDYSHFKRTLFADMVERNPWSTSSQSVNAGTTGFQPVISSGQARSLCSSKHSQLSQDWHRRFHGVPHRENMQLQSITFQLYDSLPKDVVKKMKQELHTSKGEGEDKERYIKLHKRISEYEDSGYGQCFLNDERVASMVQEALKHFDGIRYRLICWCIMPNHVHVLIDVTEGWSLSQIMHGWRSYTANEANKILGRSGQFWMEEYFDRYIRNENHLENVIDYILNNPAKAGLNGWRWVGFGTTGFQPVISPGQARSLCSSEKEWQLLLFKKTQKLLDRLLFIFFAEDSGLLPPNSMLKIIDQWEKLKELDEYQPLYSRIKKYFGYMNTGFHGKNYEVFAYNGGLFKPDEVLDSITISDEPLAEHTRRLSTYDYGSEVDVNILGHIFENSLTEIELVSQQIGSTGFQPVRQAENLCSQTGGMPVLPSKRKQDGVFYTPQYITKYIVQNTVGRLCTEKKQELGIIEEEYFTDRNRHKQTKIRLLQRLQQYRQWLLGITILDPACGSGAFLNAALQFLIAEHALIDEMEAKLTDASIVFQGIENSILENNLYGVDINEESVEIAQLALWLRTAKPHRKLNTLNQNIKCGNSLISNPAVAGNKAFDWQREFPQVFERGGFDVVIGNPPYVHLESVPEVSQQLEQFGYTTYNKRGDMYCLFVEKAFQLAKPQGMVSYIMPNKWLQASYGKELRGFFLGKQLEKLIDFGDIQIFEGATTYPCIFIGRNNNEGVQASSQSDGQDARAPRMLSVSVLNAANAHDFNQNVLATEEPFDLSEFSSDTWVISSQKDKALLERLSRNNPTLKEYILEEAYYGIKTGFSEAFLIDKTICRSITAQDSKAWEHIFPFLQGRHITPYGKTEAASYLILFEKGWTLKALGALASSLSDGQDAHTPCEAEAWQLVKDRYPSIAEWLEPFAEKGRKRTDKGDYWWELRACDYYDQFAKPKIMYQAFQVKPCFIYDEQGFYSNNSMWFIPTGSKALLAVLNSQMGWWLITKFCSQIQGGYQLIWKYFGQIPVPICNDESLSELADSMLSLHEQLQEKRSRFLRRLQENFEGVKTTTALQTFDQMAFADFTKELKKQKISLSLSQQDEWEDYFGQYQSACREISSQIDQTNREIDQRVFDLYGLTEEERNIVLKK